MFIRYYAEIDAPAEAVTAALLDGPDAWLPGLAKAAGDRGEELLVEVGFGSERCRLECEVELTVRRPIVFPSRTTLPISWKPRGHRHLLPELEADVEVAPLGEHHTQLSISARYQPPLGALGKALDRALLHRVAEATVKDFLDGVARRLTTAPISAR